MKQTIRVSLSILSTLGLTAVPSLALAGGGLTGGATLPEQIVQEATSVKKLAEQVETVETEISQYENMIQNMIDLPQTLIGQALQPIDQLYGLVGQAEALGTNAQNIAQQFQSLHANFNPQITQEYVQHYQSITSGLQNAIDTALKTANLNPNNFATEAQAQQAIQQALQNPNSRNALLQASAAVGQATVTDLTQMEQTLNAETTAEETWRKSQLEQQESTSNLIGKMNEEFINPGPAKQTTLSGSDMNGL